MDVFHWASELFSKNINRQVATSSGSGDLSVDILLWRLVCRYSLKTSSDAQWNTSIAKQVETKESMLILFVSGDRTIRNRCRKGEIL